MTISQAKQTQAEIDICTHQLAALEKQKKSISVPEYINQKSALLNQLARLRKEVTRG